MTTQGLIDKNSIACKLQKLVWKAAKEFDKTLKIEDVRIEHPASLDHGDYSSNIAMILAKRVGKKPIELAGLIAKELNNSLSTHFHLAGVHSHTSEVSRQSYLDRVEIVFPGFINFWLSKQFLLDSLNQSIKEKEKFGSSEVGKGKTVVIDYSAPNIARPFGIGHLRSTIIGQALYNIYEFLGWKTIGDNHLGDWGTQFGKMIVAIKKWGDKKVLKLTVKDLEALYVKFHQEVEKDSTLDDEARAWFKKLEDGNSEAREIWQACVNVSMKEFNRVYEILGVKIDYVLGESFYEDKMDEVVEDAKKKELAKKSQGALVINIPKMKVPVILLKSDGATTYQTRDLATIKYRVKTWKPDLYIYEVGTDQTFYFKQVFGAAVLLGYGALDQFVHVAHGMMRLPEGKLSTRKGRTIHLDEVLEEVIERAEKLAQKAGIAEVVGVGAMKYNDLKQRPETNIVFDWDKILSLEGDSGPYLQYTYARARSVLRKAKILSTESHLQGVHSATSEVVAESTSCEVNSEELAILRTIYQFPEVVLESAKSFSPNLICHFLFDLAQKFNAFYNQCPIINAKSEKEKNFRLLLTASVVQTLKNGLTLLGIETLEKM